MEEKSMLRPRWRTFSVSAHNDLASLIPEILLYDRLVFPIPTDDDDQERWEKNKRNLDQLDKRILELGDLAHPTPWTREWCDEWSTRWERLQQLVRDTKGLAMNLTPQVLAFASVWNDRFPPPIMIADELLPRDHVIDPSAPFIRPPRILLPKLGPAAIVAGAVVHGRWRRRVTWHFV
jgi:hypothetical protein